MQPSAFLSRVLTDVPGCPDVLALQAIVDAAVELFDETGIWSVVGEPALMSSLLDLYEPDSISGARVDRIKAVWCGKRQLVHKINSALYDALPDWQTARAPEPSYYNSPDGSSVRVYPMPFNVAPGTTLTIEAIYVPKDDLSSSQPTIPDRFGLQYRDAIVAGAKARLMLTPDRKWTNERLSGFHRSKFEEALSEVRIRAIHEGQQGSIYVRPVSFGGV